MHRISVILVFFLFLVAGCQESPTKFPETKNIKPDLIVNVLNLMPVQCDPIDASYVGTLHWVNDSLFYIDEKFCALFVFDIEGNFISQHLSQGPGPNELATKNIVGYCFLDDKKHFFIGPSNDCYVFNPHFQKDNFYIITRGEMLDDKPYDSPFYYTLSYPKLIMRSYGGNIYTNVYCEHPDLHMFNSYSRYVSKAHYLAMINGTNGLMEKVFGNYTLPYRKENTKQFTLVNYDIDQSGNFYISLEADSLIYTYDNSFNPLIAFGYSGKGMTNDYMELNSIRDFRRESSVQRETRSHYTWLEYIDEREMLFRSYQKDEGISTDGLQIYQKNTLIGDLDVPKGFKVIGYSAPYFIASVPINEDEETIMFYKFNL